MSAFTQVNMTMAGDVNVVSVVGSGNVVSSGSGAAAHSLLAADAPLPRAHPGLNFISVAGPIAVGKTTFAKSLARHLALPFVDEPHVQNMYLKDFYEDRKGFALRVNLNFLLSRMMQHEECNTMIGYEDGFVQDRSAFEDRVFPLRMFAAGDMDEKDFTLYMGYYAHFVKGAMGQYPDAFVYLHAPVDKLLARVEKRGREYEMEGTNKIDKDYLASFEAPYSRFVHDMSCQTRVFSVDWSEDRDDLDIDVLVAKVYTKMTKTREKTGLFEIEV